MREILGPKKDRVKKDWRKLHHQELLDVAVFK
jgi:hypothetical protein